VAPFGIGWIEFRMSFRPRIGQVDQCFSQDCRPKRTSMEGHRTLDAEVVQAVVGRPMPTLGSSWDSAITRLLETNSLGEVSGPAL
jgi:hypothetical protein